MQSLVLTRDGLQVADTPITPLMPGDVRIEVRSVGISGTDLAIWKGDLDAPLPLILGREIAGVIHETVKKASSISVSRSRPLDSR